MTEPREIARQTGLPQNLEDLHEAAYVDRFGDMHLLLFEDAEKLAHAHASTEPEIVLMRIEDFESEYRAKGYEPGNRYYHDIRREETPGLALAHYWPGMKRRSRSCDARSSGCASWWSRRRRSSRRPARSARGGA
jgi:hypothetical protein